MTAENVISLIPNIVVFSIIVLLLLIRGISKRSS